MNFNEIQKLVITYDTTKNIFLLAGAGSGKTTCIIERIRYLINIKKVNPTRILGLTFTNKAAKQMQTRLMLDDVCLKTFHKFALDFLNENQEKTKIALINDNINELFHRLDLLKISNYKNKTTKIKPLIFHFYNCYLKEHNLYDFDDLLLLLEKHLSNQTNLSILKNRYDYILIDEFQDTNTLQYGLIKKIWHDKVVLAVGDPDQSIYLFRGACSKVIQSYIIDFNANVITMNINYRSTSKIIEFANKVISKNPHLKHLKKDLIPFNKSEGIVRMISFNTIFSQYCWLINSIKSLLNKRVKHQEIAVLARNNHELYEFARMLDNTYIPYYLSNSFDSNENHNHTYVNLLTIHKSKGLEFEYVFLINCSKNNLPSYKMTTTRQFIQEERRLFFVAITRAKFGLFIMYIKKRSMFLT